MNDSLCEQLYRRSRRMKAYMTCGAIFALLLVGLLFHTFLVHDKQSFSKQNMLSISGPWEFTSIEPSKHGYIYSRMQVVETLLDIDAEGELLPSLASAWSVSSDGLNWQFALREGVRFHDDSQLTAHDVKVSLEHALKTHGALNQAPILAISTPQPHTLTIALHKPYPMLGVVLANYANAILSHSAFNHLGQVQTLIGTGPYRLHTFAPPHKLVVARFDHYWGKVASIQFACYLTGHRAESRVLQAKSGEADIVFTIDPATFHQLAGEPQLTIVSASIPRTLLLKLNSAHPLLASPDLRLALSLALDRSGIASSVLHDAEMASDQLLPASMAGWHLPARPVPPQNLKQADALLRSHGWELNQHGIRQKQGQLFELRLITYADRPELTAVATAIQEQWARLGVKLTIDVTNSSMIPAGHQDNSLEVALSARNFGFIANPLATLLQDYANGGGDWGAMHWHHPALAQLARESEQELPLRRYTLAAAKAIYDEKPVLPIAHYKQHIALNSRVKGFRFDPYERSYYLNEMYFSTEKAEL